MKAFTWHPEFKPWHPVMRGFPPFLDHPQVIAKNPALLLCWPPYSNALAEGCLNHFKGDTIIYVGEGSHGCTGTVKFHERLEADWEQIEYVQLPQYDGIHDALTIHRRKE